MAGYWLKLYVEILDDSKYSRLSDAARAGMFELMLVAKRFGNNGDLPAISEVAFQTRRTEEWWQPVIKELEEINFVTIIPGEGTSKLSIRKFAERQAPISSTERSRQHRKVKHNIGYPQRKGNGSETKVQRKVTENRTETEENRTETDTEQTTPVVVVSEKPKDKIPLKAKAASMLTARMVAQSAIVDLLEAYRPDMLIDYCHAYDQAVDDGKASNPGWLVTALKQQYDIKMLLKKRDDVLLQSNPARYVVGKYSELVEH